MLKEKILAQFSKNFRTFYPKRLSLSAQKYGFGIRYPSSGVRNPKKTYFGSRIQGSKRHRMSDPDSQHCSGLFFYYLFLFYLPGEWLVGEERTVELPQQVVQQQHHVHGNPRPTGRADSTEELQSVQIDSSRCCFGSCLGALKVTFWAVWR